MTKTKASFYLASVLFLSMIISGCFFFPRDTLLRVYNETAGGLSGVLEAPGHDPEEFSVDGKEGTDDVFTELRVTFEPLTSNMTVSVTIDGFFKNEEIYTIELERSVTGDIVIEPDTGNVGFLNHSGNAVLWAWLVPTDPLTYTARTQVEANAVITIQDLESEGYDGGRCEPGNYYVIYETADGYYYQDTPVSVQLNEHVNASAAGGTAHPSL